jgi:hypothetical protein
MRIGGIEINGPHEALLVLPHGEQQVAFRARAILDFDPFYEQCPEPVAPVKMTKDGTVPDLENAGYKSAKLEHERRKNAWIILQTLEPSQIEWDSVKMDVPGTWVNYAKDLRDNGFSVIEINRIVDLVMEANCLDESKLKWAREVLVLGQQKSPQA